MFRDDSQRAEVCNAVCKKVRLPALWTKEGPSDTAKELLENGGGPLSHGEKVMLFIAWDLWNGRSTLTFAEVIETLDRHNLKLVGEILIALAGGPDAIDKWLKDRLFA